MKEYEKSVPFDPGYSPLSFSFMENIGYVARDFALSKAMHQKKFKLAQIESKVLELINKSTAFYLGCLLWGGFLQSRFKDAPKEITGNHTSKLSPEEAEKLDCAEETKFTLHYIELFKKDCKYYLNKTIVIPEILIEILNSYNEFAQINNNFVKVKKTSDIKLPKSLSHFDKLTNKELDELHKKIKDVIASRKVEGLLDIGFYKK